MKLKLIKPILFTIISVFSLGVLSSAPTYADSNICDSGAAPEVLEAAGCTSGSSDALPNIIITALNAVIGVAGLVAVIFVIVGGFNYMTSSGDPGKIKKAKDTILYAVIGLIICVLAFAIVNFVIKNFL